MQDTPRDEHWESCEDSSPADTPSALAPPASDRMDPAQQGSSYQEMHPKGREEHLPNPSSWNPSGGACRKRPPDETFAQQPRGHAPPTTVNAAAAVAAAAVAAAASMHESEANWLKSQITDLEQEVADLKQSNARLQVMLNDRREESYSAKLAAKRYRVRLLSTQESLSQAKEACQEDAQLLVQLKEKIALQDEELAALREFKTTSLQEKHQLQQDLEDLKVNVVRRNMEVASLKQLMEQLQRQRHVEQTEEQRQRQQERERERERAHRQPENSKGAQSPPQQQTQQSWSQRAQQHQERENRQQQQQQQQQQTQNQQPHVPHQSRQHAHQQHQQAQKEQRQQSKQPNQHQQQFHHPPPQPNQRHHHGQPNQQQRHATPEQGESNPQEAEERPQPEAPPAPAPALGPFADPAVEAPALGPTSSVQVLKAYLVQAGVTAVQMSGMEKAEILDLALKKSGSWECRRLLACAALQQAGQPLWHCVMAAFRHPTVFATVPQLHKELVLLVHPDKNPGDAAATPAFQFLQQAFAEMRRMMQLQQAAKTV